MDNYGYIAHISEDGTKEIYGTASNNASRVMYDQNGTKVSVQKKISDIDTVLGQDFIISDSSKAYNSNTSYSVGNTCVSSERVYECIVACKGIQPPNTTYWKEVTLSALNTKVNNATSHFKDEVYWFTSSETVGKFTDNYFAVYRYGNVVVIEFANKIKSGTYHNGVELFKVPYLPNIPELYPNSSIHFLVYGGTSVHIMRMKQNGYITFNASSDYPAIFSTDTLLIGELVYVCK